jgi:hypothetical protein
MTYQEPLFRPPAEANSLIFQIAYGCPHKINPQSRALYIRHRHTVKVDFLDFLSKNRIRACFLFYK